VAQRFMKAFLRGVRDFKDSLVDGHWRADGKADDVIRIFATAVNIPEPIVRRMSPQFADPDGAINLESLRKDLAFFKETGDVKSTTITADAVVDTSFAAAAAKELGPYQPKTP
jgi:NitT/TauT family transport system substrate-binding protein